MFDVAQYLAASKIFLSKSVILTHLSFYYVYGPCLEKELVRNAVLIILLKLSKGGYYIQNCLKIRKKCTKKPHQKQILCEGFEFLID